MDELADVKAKVKTWERAFRRDKGRAPTKEDIRLGGEIAEQYALWRKLSKEAEKLKAKGKENGKRKAEEKEPRRRDELTTPPPRRRAARLPTPPPPLRFSEAGPSSRPAVTPSMSTPKRRRLDDNPFSVPRAPREPEEPSPSVLGVHGTPKRERFDYVHASTPKQLKALLESARKSVKKDTPRTHARRWLAGEVDSPVHRKREFRGRAQEEDEEELGETPVKGEAFAILDDEPKGRDLFPIFRRAASEASHGADKERGGKRKGRETEDANVPRGKDRATPTNGKRRMVEADAPSKKPRPSLDEALRNPEAMSVEEDVGGEAVAAPPPTTPPRPARARATSERVLELTDDELDPEASPVVLTITGTRRTFDPVDDDDIFDMPDAAVDEDGDEEEAEEVEVQGAEGEDPRAMLSLLSLRSPIARAGERMADLRVRALLDPTSAAAVALRAKRRGQDVFACGETGFEEEYLEIGEEVEIEGDDDWESDPEGWKGEVDDEEW
ncbi:hypothetical protein CC85DRAFT_329351 [Cutaneotrichosporon oleaginosum]|uniref:DNA replication regulator SLD2 n=1 Tax=Cutaneotrichosporon oleaginosum TaxID=879819 RepID=A0A0J0XJ81_9TREE|nr:uncharacterized protein CC85DRAFT_329351 [Cutaneotrichosporon oleaginosum]KLT41123.1 hypothetical protein CC85DRAFT_329351 [Cutaneotrichosporon oleaginosum]TXT05745.1 hypothetical protein COLE_07065 [Cutaneotrichosporon oleaginosum]